MKKILFLFLTLCSSIGTVYGDITWSAPTAISTPLTNASNPVVVIDSNNNITAAWVENSVIMSSSFPSGGSWSTPVALSNISNTASNPTLALDSTGNVTALWVENAMIESATFPVGGSWSAETSPISGSGASNPALAVDSSGNAVGVWVRSGYIESSTRISGTWSLVSVLSTVNASNPDVAISDLGIAMAVWHGLSAGGADIIVSDILTISSNTWAASQNVFTITPSFFHNYPKVVLDVFGNANVAWFRYNHLDDDSYQNVQVISSALPYNSSAWTLQPAYLSNFGIRNPADLSLQLGCDSNGDVVAVWTNSYDGQTFSLESNRVLFGGLWGSPGQPQSPSLYTFGIDLSIVSGTALLASMAWDGVSNVTIQTQEGAVGNPIFQSWTDSNQMSTAPDNAYPQCAISVTGSAVNAAIVWIYYNGTNVVINASTGSDTALSPPTSVSATQSVTDFGVFKDYYNTITWGASSEPDILQYNIFRNGVFFGGVDSSTFEFVDDNQLEGDTVTYGVAALLSGFLQTDIISYTLFP